MDRAMFTVSQAAERLGLSRVSLLALIHSGGLAAVDVGQPAAKRPTWRVPADELADFQERRRYDATADRA